MSKASPVNLDLSKCHLLEDFQVWVDDVEGKVFFHHVPTGTSYSRIPRNLRGMPPGFVPASKAALKASRRRASSGPTPEASDVEQSSGAKAGRASSKSPKRSRKISASAALERTVAVQSTGDEEASSPDELQMLRKERNADASSSLLSLTDMRRTSASSIAAMLKQLKTDKFRIWKKRDDAVELLEGRCSPCVKLLASYIPEELTGEWEFHEALGALKENLDGTSFNVAAKSSGKGFFKKVRTQGGLALAQVKKAVRLLEHHLQGLQDQDAERMCVSQDLLEQATRPDTAKEDEFSFSVPFLVVWRVLMRSVPPEWQPYGNAWRRALLPLLACTEPTNDTAPTSVNSNERVTALAFSDFAVLFAPLDTWWQQVRKLLDDTPHFFWFEHKSTPGDANLFVKKPRVGNYLFRFSGSKRRRIVLQFVSGIEMAMRSAELHSSASLVVKWDSAPVDVVAGNEGGLCQYQFLGERYESLDSIAEAYREHFSIAVDKSRFCPWFWSEPVAAETVAAAIEKGGEGSFAVTRTKSERASYVLFHYGPEGVRDFLLNATGGVYSIEFDGHHVEAPSITKLLYAACAHGRFSNAVLAPHVGASMRERLMNQPTVYFAGKLTATT